MPQDRPTLPYLPYPSSQGKARQGKVRQGKRSVPIPVPVRFPACRMYMYTCTYLPARLQPSAMYPAPATVQYLKVPKYLVSISVTHTYIVTYTHPIHPSPPLPKQKKKSLLLLLLLLFFSSSLPSSGIGAFHKCLPSTLPMHR